ncbi:MAG TPA: hypothetical protein VLK22_04455 [Candidatus Udaeobacter sp.]|nr:hypothetical protein [Candidatus Udaeobacter sp.]
MSEPMVTIKKPDGTFAKVSLSEFKKAQSAQTKPKEAAKPKMPARSGSLLEEKLKLTNSTPLFSPKREKQVEEVISKLGFSVALEILGRLKSLVLAKLKDIKSEEEIRELMSRSIKNGGLGLTAQQVEKIINLCAEVDSQEDEKISQTPVLKGKPANLALMVEPPELPALIDALPAAANKMKMPEQKQTRPFAADSDPISNLINKSIASEPVFKIDTRPAVKQSMQDITATSVEMGPVEEIRSVTLADFRRFSSKPEEAAKRLQQKMFNLQDESFVWYLEALAGYHASPLYTEYVQAVCQSLAERKSLANVLTIKNGIKLNEVIALIEMEKSL